MRRRSSGLVPILLIMIILGGIALLTIRIKQNPIFGHFLTEEFVPENVIVRGVFSVDYGKVYEVRPTKSGWEITESNKAIYEKLVLEGVDLSQNDVILPHLFDWYFDGVNDYIDLTDGGSEWDFSILTASVQFRTVMYGWQGIIGEGAKWRFYLEATNKLTFWVRNTSATDYERLTYPTTIEVNEQYHVIGIYEYPNMYLYVDSTTPATKTTTIIMNPDGNDNQVIGAEYRGSNVHFHGYISYVCIYNVSMYNDIKNILNHIIKYDPTNMILFLDATIYNGTYYLDLSPYSNHGAPHGGVQRVSAEQMWLWLVKGLASDNKIHFMYFPRGSIIRIKDSMGNVVCQFVIDKGTIINEDDQIEDYAIDLPRTSILQCTIEAWVPSMKIRVYGPPSAKVEIVKDNVIYGSGVIGSSGYADIQISQKLKDAEIWVVADPTDNQLQVDVREQGDYIIVTVLDESNVLVPHALVIVKDAAGAVVAYAETDESGQVKFDKNELSAGLLRKELTFEVKAIWKGYYYEAKPLTYIVQEPQQTITQTISENKEQYMLYALGLLAIILIVILVARARK